MDMDRFFNDQNLERLRSLASIATTEAERKILLDLLATEKVKFIKLAEGQNDSAWLKLRHYLGDRRCAGAAGIWSSETECDAVT
jgi:hypothetical protein